VELVEHTVVDAGVRNFIMVTIASTKMSVQRMKIAGNLANVNMWIVTHFQESNAFVKLVEVVQTAKLNLDYPKREVFSWDFILKRI